MMTITLQAASFSNPQDGSQARTSDMRSTDVPLESWVYPAFERLVAEELRSTAFSSLRPWTRMDCARLVDGLRATVDNALRPEWELRLEEQTESWHARLLSAAQQHNAAFTLQLSYRPIGGARE